MPWPKGDYPPSYKNQPKYLREKAVEIANEVLRTTGNEGEAIATGLKQARAHFKNHPEEVPAKRKWDAIGGDQILQLRPGATKDGDRLPFG